MRERDQAIAWVGLSVVILCAAVLIVAAEPSYWHAGLMAGWGIVVYACRPQELDHE